MGIEHVTPEILRSYPKTGESKTENKGKNIKSATLTRTSVSNAL
jgi:hypothetical protein